MTRDHGVMSMELFERIINDAKGLISVEFITHGGMGEPLRDDFLTEKIALEKSVLNAQVQVHTNGSLLDEENIRKIFASKLDVLSISLNAFHAMTHKNTTGLDYEMVRRNIEAVFSLKEKLKAKTQIRVTMVRIKDMPQKEIDNFQNYWKQFTPHVSVHPMKNWAYFGTNIVKGRKYPCKWVWYMMSINWDGKVNICHEDFDGRIVIGDLAKERIVDVFNCETIQKVRKHFYNTGEPLLDICKDCSRLQMDKFWWYNAEVSSMRDGTTKYSEPLHGGVCW